MNGATASKLYAGGCRKHLALLLIVFLLAALIIVEPLPVTAQEPPLVQFSDVTYSVDENAGSATITVTLSIPPSDTATVDYVTSDGTATAGIGPDYDYIASSGSLTFGAQETSKTFTVAITDDLLDEFDETVNLALSNANGATLGNDSTATLTIADNDGPIVAFSSATYDVAENIVLATITVSLSAPSVQTVAVDYASSDESASAGYDYNSTLGTLVFNPGDLIKTFAIPITDDSIDEVNETLHLQLSNADNAVLGDPIAATVTIADNDGPTVAFTAASFSASEGVGFATITVTLGASSPQAVTVDYATSDGTAVAGEGPGYDYVTSSGVLTYAPGEISKTFTITISEDSADEVDETINLTLSNPGNCTLGIIYTATLTIADNDGPTVTFSSTPYVASEAAGTATITVSLSLASVQAVTVRYTTSNGTAIAGNDYTYATGTLTFMPGELVKTFVVQISNDVLDELDETVNLTLSYPTNASIGTPNPVALTIVDNDTPPTVQFSSPTYTLNENGGTITLTVILSTASGTTVTVDYATSDGTATSVSDYTSASGTLTFAAGVTSATLSVSVADDDLNEVSETVIVTLSNPSHASLGASNPATVTIVDNDGPTVTLSATTYSVGEGEGQAIITVNLSLPPALTVTVNYATTNGTASSSSDYAATSGTLTFLPNETSKTFIIPITSDLTDEVNETVNIAISNPAIAPWARQTLLSSPFRTMMIRRRCSSAMLPITLAKAARPPSLSTSALPLLCRSLLAMPPATAPPPPAVTTPPRPAR